MDIKESTSLMIKRAIASARNHGINLVPGRLNPAQGDCAFQSVIYNNNDRKCYSQKYYQPVDTYRRLWISDFQAKSLNNSPWNLGYTKQELWDGFEEMKQPGTYTPSFFGDLLLPIISVGIHKNILIFNTHEETSHDPISVISPLNFDGFVDSQVPIIVAYNSWHFESMHPVTDEDVDLTKNLVQSYINGQYRFKRSDMKNLINLENIELVQTVSLPKNMQLRENAFKFSSFGKSYTVKVNENGSLECPIC